MKDYRAAMLQSLVAVAWADQELHEREVEVIEALMAAFGLREDEAAIVREFARTPRTLDDLPLSALSSDDRRLLVSHALVLAYAEGDPGKAELGVIDQLIERLRIPEQEAISLLAAGHAHAQRLAPLRDRANADALEPGA